MSENILIAEHLTSFKDSPTFSLRTNPAIQNPRIIKLNSIEKVNEILI